MKAIITVLGKDRVGIIATVCNALSQQNVNILDISQTLLQGGLFTMIMLVDTSGCKIPFAELGTLLRQEGERIGVDVRIQREDIFNAMHRI